MQEGFGDWFLKSQGELAVLSFGRGETGLAPRSHHYDGTAYKQVTCYSRDRFDRPATQVACEGHSRAPL
jgi:hypothetical protein